MGFTKILMRIGHEINMNLVFGKTLSSYASTKSFGLEDHKICVCVCALLIWQCYYGHGQLSHYQDELKFETSCSFFRVEIIVHFIIYWNIV